MEIKSDLFTILQTDYIKLVLLMWNLKIIFMKDY